MNLHKLAVLLQLKLVQVSTDMSLVAKSSPRTGKMLLILFLRMGAPKLAEGLACSKSSNVCSELHGYGYVGRTLWQLCALLAQVSKVRC